MALGAFGILDKVVSHAMALGLFETVNQHEPKNAPGDGLRCSVWVDSIVPVRTSGLNSTSVRLVFNVRLYSNMIGEPQDQIDPNLILAADGLLAEYIGDFTLGGVVRKVDVFGSDGVALSAQAGYLEQDKKIYRVITITLPLVVNDVWEQVE